MDWKSLSNEIFILEFGMLIHKRKSGKEFKRWCNFTRPHDLSCLKLKKISRMCGVPWILIRRDFTFEVRSRLLLTDLLLVWRVKKKPRIVISMWNCDVSFLVFNLLSKDPVFPDLFDLLSCVWWWGLHVDLLPPDKFDVGPISVLVHGDPWLGESFVDSFLFEWFLSAAMFLQALGLMIDRSLFVLDGNVSWLLSLYLVCDKLKKYRTAAGLFRS
jgi:hypothetical protein